jgi:tetratricopeptide (TPR) repeat protein
MRIFFLNQIKHFVKRLMARKFILTISNAFKSCAEAILSFPDFIKKQSTRFVKDLYQLRYNLNNLAESNMNLGIYHLRCRNYNDAIFRFKLVDKFLDPNNKLANYWLGWAYFMKLDYKKSIICLEKAGDADEVSLLPFVKSIDNVTFIPPEIHLMHREIIADVIVDKYTSADENIVLELVGEFNSQAQNLPEEYKILELGANIGILGDEINKRMQESFKLTGVEISEKMITLQSECFPEKALYDRVVHSSVESFLAKESEKYDVIYSLEGFATSLDLKNIFESVFSVLNEGGYFAFIGRIDRKNCLTPNLLEFAYTSQYIKDALSASGFRILSTKDFSLEIKNNYSIFVCNK